MSPSKRQSVPKSVSFKQKVVDVMSLKTLWSILFDPRKIVVVAVFLGFLEIVVTAFVINSIKYTEIDWIAYMQEVEGVINGTFDYSKLRGNTGPLVYPAGFVYIFGFLYYITNHGTNIKCAQVIFAGFYLIVLMLVFRIYYKTQKVPPYAILVACCTSYRIHSIFILRLFNDNVAVLLVYMAINLFLENYWSLGSIIFSLAVSVKMNILLYAPALMLSYYYCLGFKGTIKQLFLCGLVQIILGLPFLLTNPLSYIKGSFDLGRIFLQKWTVNWRFLPEPIFMSRYFHLFLLIVHILLLVKFSSSWVSHLRSYATLKGVESQIKSELKKKKQYVNMNSSAQLLIWPMFTSNFIGIVCCRSLHYQFYVWYFHTLPYLLWSTPFSNKMKLIIMGVIELCWNTYPSTALSSGALHISHIAIIIGLLRSMYKM